MEIPIRQKKPPPLAPEAAQGLRGACSSGSGRFLNINWTTQQPAGKNHGEELAERGFLWIFSVDRYPDFMDCHIL